MGKDGIRAGKKIAGKIALKSSEMEKVVSVEDEKTNTALFYGVTFM